MRARIALACCSLWPTGSGDHAGLAEAVADRGARADWVPWDDPVADWSDYDLVLLRETWDYPAKLPSFLAWVDSLSMLTSVVNPPAVVRWNHHKRYLQELAATGVPTVPTTVVARVATDPYAALRAAGARTVVVSPLLASAGTTPSGAGQTILRQRHTCGRCWPAVTWWSSPTSGASRPAARHRWWCSADG